MNAASLFYERLVEALMKRGFVWGPIKCYDLYAFDGVKGHFYLYSRDHFYKFDVDPDYSWSTVYRYALHRPSDKEDCVFYYYSYHRTEEHRYMFAVPLNLIKEIIEEMKMQDFDVSVQYKVDKFGHLVEHTLKHEERDTGLSKFAYVPEDDPLHPEIIKLMNIYS